MTPEELEQAFEQAKANGDMDSAFQIQQQLNAAKQAKQATAKDAFQYIAGLARLGAEGLTFGQYDELAGAVSAAGAMVPGGKSPREAYVGTRNAQRRLRSEFEEENPKAAFAAEFTGGALTGGYGAGRASASRFLRTKPSVTRYTLSGAGAGGLYGLGTVEGENPEDVFASPGEMAAGTATGAAFGGATGVFVKPLEIVARFAGDWISRAYSTVMRDEDQRAVQRIARAFAEDDIPLSDVQRRMDDLGPEATLMDAGGANVVGQVEGAANRPGPAREIITNRLAARDAKVGDRVIDSARANLNANLDDYAAEKGRIIERQRRRSEPLYDQAYRTEINNGSPVLQDLANNGEVKKVWKKAYSAVMDDPRVPDYVKRSLDPDTPNLAFWDKIKQSLDDAYRVANRKGESGRAGMLLEIKNKLVGELDSQVPVYGKARAIYSDDAGRLDAMKMGLEVFKGDTVLTVEQFKALPKDQQELFRLGAGAAMKELVRNTDETAEGLIGQGMFRRIFGSQAKRDLWKEIFPKQTFGDFAKLMQAEQKFRNNRNRVLANSATARREAQARQDGAGPIADAMDAASGTGGPGLVREIWGKVKEAIGGKTRKEIDRILAERLTDSDARAIQQTLMDLQNKPRWAQGVANLTPQQFRTFLANPDNVKRLETTLGVTGGVAVGAGD